jgi:predicted lipoprotein with Yx(FWY)xxD motif
VIVAGCGSSGSSTTRATSTAAAGSAAQTSPGYAAGSAAQTSPGYAAATPASTPKSGSAGAVLIGTKHNKLGTILAAGPKQMTVYLFEGDSGARSACTGACTHVWPPVRTTGEARSSGGAMAADLGVITRSDGTKQVTYKGHPLYLFARDGDRGDAYGQGVNGFGASWYVLSPSGTKVDHS